VKGKSKERGIKRMLNLKFKSKHGTKLEISLGISSGLAALVESLFNIKSH